MSTKQTLERARGLIEKPEDWCQHLLSHEGEAPFCALGAVMKVTEAKVPAYRFNDELLSTEYNEAHRALREVVGMDPATYNNEHDHKCVLTMFDAAIEAS